MAYYSTRLGKGEKANMKVIETLWFTNLDGVVGIVIIEEDVTGDRKAYIGSADGHDTKADTDKILAFGNKFSLDTAQRIEHHLTNGAATRLRDTAAELLEACKSQHQAIDRLFAELIKRDETFFPSKSGHPWEAVVKGNTAITKAEITKAEGRS